MALIQELAYDYHEWLMELMRIDLPEHRNYRKLMYDLDTKEFIWLHPMDENRDIDAFDLRKEYFFDNGLDVSEVWTSPRSCLEVLAALSRRIEIEITGEPGNDHIERWFWIMISNLGLDRFDDDHYDHGYVEYILDVWLARKFEKNGKCGLFPLKKATSDQRDVDIWYQMQAYLMENYEF
jgi:hypothetical protein